jgi:hypothetical protein
MWITFYQKLHINTKNVENFLKKRAKWCVFMIFPPKKSELKNVEKFSTIVEKINIKK